MDALYIFSGFAVGTLVGATGGVACHTLGSRLW